MINSIFFVSPEVSPYAKTSGLADYSIALPKFLKRKDIEISIFMPKYRAIDVKYETITDFPVVMNDRKETCIIRRSIFQDRNISIPIYFIDNYHYFDRDRLYDYKDEGERFAFFCNAFVKYIELSGVPPQIIHLNDWQTGMIAALIRNGYKRREMFKNTASIFTIHNIWQQGNFNPDILKYLNLEEDIYDVDGVEFYGDVSFLKAGIVFADKITTVSKTYAKEIQQSEYGERMEGILRKRSSDLRGILNGIDYDIYDPKTSPYVYQPYSIKTIEKKVENKYYLQKMCNLSISDNLLISMVSRINEQKGFGIVIEVLERILKKNVQVVILGEGDNYYQRILSDLASRYSDKFRLFLKFDTPLAQKIYAGADCILLPSKSEPCGMAHMIALRFGTIPIARLTGGLADSIIEYREEDQEGNGFVFLKYSAQEFYEAIEKAEYYYNKKEHWLKIIENAMKKDFSWDRTAQEYIEIYKAAYGKLSMF